MVTGLRPGPAPLVGPPAAVCSIRPSDHAAEYLHVLSYCLPQGCAWPSSNDLPGLDSALATAGVVSGRDASDRLFSQNLCELQSRHSWSFRDPVGHLSFPSGGPVFVMSITETSSTFLPNPLSPQSPKPPNPHAQPSSRRACLSPAGCGLTVSTALVIFHFNELLLCV